MFDPVLLPPLARRRSEHPVEIDGEEEHACVPVRADEIAAAVVAHAVPKAMLNKLYTRFFFFIFASKNWVFFIKAAS